MNPIAELGLVALTFAALYGLSLLCAMWHRHPPEPPSEPAPARPQAVRAPGRRPYDGGGILAFHRREPGEDEL